MKIIKKILIKLKNSIPGFVVGVILAITITVVCASGLLSSTVTYDNSNSGLESTTVQGALDELNEIAENSSGGGAYVYAWNTSSVYYTGTNQSTLNSLGTVYGTMEALYAATGYVVGLKYKIEDNKVTEAYVCGLYNGTTEFCIKGYTDGTYYEKNQTILTNIFVNYPCTENTSYYWCKDFGTSIEAYAYTNGEVYDYDSDTFKYCYVYNSGYAKCQDMDR